MSLCSSAAYDLVFDSCYRRVAAQTLLPSCAPDLRSGVAFDILFAAHLGAHGKWTRKTSWRHRTPAALSAFVAAYEAGSTITELAASPGVNTSPFLLARALVEVLLHVPRSAVGALVREPHARIPDARLAHEVAAAAEADAHCSPYVDRLRAWAGEEGEWRLAAGLTARGLCSGSAWIGEEVLRARGAARTPDVLFRWPIVFPCPYTTSITSSVVASTAPACCNTHSSSCNGHTISWIDSKAMFFDGHASNESSPQLSAYATLYGAGAVVAWGGFVTELEPCCITGSSSSGGREREIPLLLTRLPTTWRWATDEEARFARAPVALNASSKDDTPPLHEEDIIVQSDAAAIFSDSECGVDTPQEAEGEAGHLNDDGALILSRPPPIAMISTHHPHVFVASVGPMRRGSIGAAARLARLASWGFSPHT
jgi:hypothetical protein